MARDGEEPRKGQMLLELPGFLWAAQQEGTAERPLATCNLTAGSLWTQAMMTVSSL